MGWVRTGRGAHGGGRPALDSEFPAFRTGPPQPGAPRHRRGRHRRTDDGAAPAESTPACQPDPAGHAEEPAAGGRETADAGEAAGLQGNWPALRFTADADGIGVCDESGAEVARGGSVAQVQAVLRGRALAGMGSQFPRAGPGRM